VSPRSARVITRFQALVEVAGCSAPSSKAAGFQHLFLKASRTGEIALGTERLGQVVHGGKGV